jgi:hypothetical protein
MSFFQLEVFALQKLHLKQINTAIKWGTCAALRLG